MNSNKLVLMHLRLRSSSLAISINHVKLVLALLHSVRLMYLLRIMYVTVVLLLTLSCLLCNIPDNCQLSAFQIQQLWSIRHCLFDTATELLVYVFTSSRLDYFNTLL